MEKNKAIIVCLLIISLIPMPVIAEAHWRGGGALLGFGAGLITGYLFAPRPAYVTPPPVYVPPPPAPPYRPPENEYMDNNQAVPPPSAQAKCREWRLVAGIWRRPLGLLLGKWRQVPAENGLDRSVLQSTPFSI